jgi:streptogramin lyase/4-amino-4-deoxy-L-arabinose transferase-like glycosyltransferase
LARSIRPVVFGGVALAILYLGQLALAADRRFDAALLLGGGVTIFLLALGRSRYFPETAFVLPRLPWGGWRHPAKLGGLALLATASVLGGWAAREFYASEPTTSFGWLLHLTSVLLALAAAPLFDRALRTVAPGDVAPSDAAGAPPRLARRTVIGWLAIILAVAAIFRLYQFDSLPRGVWYDEAESGLQALRILAPGDYWPIFDGATAGAAHFLYLVAGSFELFGVSVQSIRTVNVFFGLAMVLAGYLVGRELFGDAVGLVVASFFAVSSWAVTFSRFGMYASNTTPLFALLTIGFLLRGWRRESMTDLALAGLWGGVGLCFYTSFRLFVPVVALFALYALLWQRWRHGRWPSSRFWCGALLGVFVALLMVAPLVVFAYKQPDIFWARIENTSLFTDRTLAEAWPLLQENIRKHFLMFNWRGDPNGRHNLPGAPMLDSITAALFIAGVAYSLRRILEPRYLLLLVWVLISLLGGIFSLDFEAPQALRANGAMAPVYLLAVIPLALLLRAWALTGGRYYPHLLYAPVGLLLAGVALLNWQTYFDRQANDFAVWNAYSTPETLAAEALANLDPNVDAYVTSYFHGHPTMRFLTNDMRYGRIETTDQLPLILEPGRSALFILNADGRSFYEEARRMYPQAALTEVTPPVPGPPVLYTIQLSPENIASVQGLDGRYYANADWAGEPALQRRDPLLDFDWASAPPLPTPFSAEWNGILRVGDYGPHDFFLEAPAHAELFIGEQQVFSGTGILSGTLTLAEGNHFLRVRAVGAPGRFSLVWRTPAEGPRVAPPSVFYVAPVSGNGLLGRYFANGAWEAPAALARIDPMLSLYFHVIPLPRPYTVEWSGKIAIPVDGFYSFGLESIDESQLWIDEQPVVAATEHNVYVEGMVQLAAGLHDIRIRYADRTDHSHINFYWTPPGGSRQVVPPEVLFPPQGDYGRVTVPDLASLNALAQATTGEPGAPVDAPGVAGVAPLLPGQARIVASGLQQPRGIAVDPEGRVYVVQNAPSQVVVLDPDGAEIGRIPADGAAFIAPTDAVADGEGVTVLEAGGGRLLKYAPDGALLAVIAEDGPLLDRSRGLGSDGQGRLWVANTPGGRALAFDAAGALAQEIAVWPGEDAQPADVQVGLDGRIFVTDPARARLVRFNADGQRERSWNIAVANTVDSPHLALDAQGRLYMTEPETGRLLQLDATGELLGMWDLPAQVGRFVKPVGVAVGPDGRIWVTDADGGNVIVIEAVE